MFGQVTCRSGINVSVVIHVVQVLTRLTLRNSSTAGIRRSAFARFLIVNLSENDFPVEKIMSVLRALLKINILTIVLCSAGLLISCKKLSNYF